MNPCPCGFLGDPVHSCTCREYSVERYRSRLSGPLLDRIDLSVTVGRVAIDELESKQRSGPGSEGVRQRVTHARNVQRERYAGNGVELNAHLPDRMLSEVTETDEAGRRLLGMAVDRWGLSPRGYVRVLRVARSIADLGKHDRVTSEHVAEALQYRMTGMETRK
jgi:magnesium chelatase family protein